MSEAKPTPGVWKWDSDPVKGDPLGRVRFRVVTMGKTITQCYYSSSDENAEADARLIADAGTVFHTTGLTPSQLVERVKELEKALMVAVNQNEHDMLMTGEELRAARAALSKARPNTAEGEAQAATTNSPAEIVELLECSGCLKAHMKERALATVTRILSAQQGGEL
jgi:hypothetical protein